MLTISNDCSGVEDGTIAITTGVVSYSSWLALKCSSSARARPKVADLTYPLSQMSGFQRRSSNIVARCGSQER